MKPPITPFAVTLFVAGATGFIVFAVWGKTLAGVFHPEVFKLFAQLSVVSVLGAGATVAYADLARARETREQRRTIHRETLAKLIEAYNDCKRVRRLLRARAICIDSKGKKLVRRDHYDLLLERLNDGQLLLEFYKRYTNWNVDLFKDVVGLAEHLEVAEKYLGRVVTEWEEETRHCEGDVPPAPAIRELDDLPRLKELVAKASEGFGPSVADPVETGLRSLARAIAGKSGCA